MEGDPDVNMAALDGEHGLGSSGRLPCLSLPPRCTQGIGQEHQDFSLRVYTRKRVSQELSQRWATSSCDVNSASTT